MEDIELSLAVTISDETTILRSIFKEVQNFTLYENSKVLMNSSHILMISFQNLVNILLLQNVFLVNIHRYEKILRQKLLRRYVHLEKFWGITDASRIVIIKLKIFKNYFHNCKSCQSDYSFVVKSLEKYIKYQRSIHTLH
ncbi:hypothetical protein Avbf_15670 [Armadillidium vulgare]|nr:hypothetical protein Avbf_15670 [Armadillidium vulgare]